MKLHIVGASGSGVTTLGLALSAILTIPYFDSDDYFWIKSEPPFINRRNPDDRNSLLKTDLTSHRDWILGGSVVHWSEHQFAIVDFDLIIFLWIPPEIRLERLKKREHERYGDLIHTDPARLKQYTEFIRWAADYDTDTGIANRTLNAHERWLNETTSPVLEIRGNFSVEERIILITNKLNNI